jgi:hypothetical protein
VNDAEYEAMCAERNAKFLKEQGREMTYNDVLASFGGGPLGQSIVTDRSTDDGRPVFDGEQS